MQIKTMLYLYDSTRESNFYRGTDFSAYILSGDNYTDDLTEVMDTAEITLQGINIPTEFAPKTKFIYEKYQSNTENGVTTWQLYKRHSLCVQEDLVNQPIISDNTYFNHHITFTEASVIAQGRIVDNIAVTYKLQDVSLKGKIDIDDNAKANVLLNNSTFTPIANFYFKSNETYLGRAYFWKFPNWFADTQYNSNITDWTNFPYYHAVPTNGTIDITLPVPMLEIQSGLVGEKNFATQCFASIDVFIQEIDSAGNIKTISNYTIDPTSSNSTEKYWFYQQTGTGYSKEGYLLNIKYYADSYRNDKNLFKKVANYAAQPLNRKITITARPKCRYVLSCKQHNFNLPSDYANAGFPYGDLADLNNLSIQSYLGGRAERYRVYSRPIFTTAVSPFARIEFATYQAGDDTRVWFSSAPEESAYNLFQKAQIATQDIEKISDTPIDETPMTFYLADEDVERLKDTRVVENFYSQKNFWEILLDIGKYIHAIPRVDFGADDRFIVSWKNLGETTQFTDTATPISIYNSRSVENYVAQCSSYVSNLVQLGGIIDEWVAPKSSSEDYLVYNDVAQIITSKNIIEIVDLEVRNINTNKIRNLTGKDGSINGYIFEQNIYNVLPENGNELANKGLAIYYNLGTNIIQGLNYRLPTASVGSLGNDYAIKNILGQAYGIDKSLWKNIKVNEYVFHIVYRTKDTARVDQTRPDLRKYLIASKYDNFPQHYQFNNQQDILVDSIKFGDNIYGKLIKTGNTNYSSKEWTDNLFALKESGQLYNIHGNLYYVAKAIHTYYADHIISEITYSKDYNQLSEIIGIPSEPRFYEISEQSILRREKSINEYILLTDDSSVLSTSKYLTEVGWGLVKKHLFASGYAFPKYAISIFKNDSDRKYGSVDGNELFYIDICTPLSVYSLRNTLTLEWDMVDNFSAGDTVSPVVTGTTTDTAYRTLRPLRYTDVFGRSDLFSFALLSDIAHLSTNDILNFPNSPVRTRYTNINYIGALISENAPTEETLTQFVVAQKGRQPQDYDGIYVTVSSENTNYIYWYYSTDTPKWNAIVANNGNEFKRPVINEADIVAIPESGIDSNQVGLGLMKDNREAMSFNFNLQMLTSSDRFVLSSTLWSNLKLSHFRVQLLSTEVNKLSTDLIFKKDILYTTSAPIITSATPSYNGLKIQIWNEPVTHANLPLLKQTKAIAITYDNNEQTPKESIGFVIAKNVTGLTISDKRQDWYITGMKKQNYPKQ